MLFLLPRESLADSWREAFVQALGNGGAYIENEEGRVLLSYRADEGFVPASTLKVATAACALRNLGADFRFKTEFFRLPGNVLGVRGAGDPSLTSEELAHAAIFLASKLGTSKSISSLLLDSSFFSQDLGLDGYEDSDNPYDALPSAISANFNTIFLERRSSGQVVSAEASSPLTPLGKELGSKLPKGSKKRINLGGTRGYPERLFAELLSHFLRQNGVLANDQFKLGPIPKGAVPFYVHQSSQTLEDLLSPMFEFSTNFTANQIFLQLGAKQYGPPANAQKGSRAVNNCLSEAFGLKRTEIHDGAGLSHRNRFPPREFVRLLRAFRPHRNLLRIDRDRFQAKTGTLKGVNTYAGYFQCDQGGEVRFAIFVNEKVPFEYKWKLAEMAYNGICRDS